MCMAWWWMALAFVAGYLFGLVFVGVLYVASSWSVCGGVPGGGGTGRRGDGEARG
jgi:hypothetical protein